MLIPSHWNDVKGQVLSRLLYMYCTTYCMLIVLPLIYSRVVDPHWFNANPDTDPDPDFFLIADLDPDPDPVLNPGKFWWPKIKKKFTAQKNYIFLIKKLQKIGLQKERTSYRKSLQPSKKNIQNFKTWKFFTFFFICRSFLPSWIRIRIQQLKLMRIRIRIHNPDLFYGL